jgi:serine/threonine-protein kinase RsbW
LKNMAQVHVPVFPSFGSRRVPWVEVQNSLPSQVAAISPFVDRLMSLIAACRAADGTEFDIEAALHEALTNAIVHGNREDPEKQVEVACGCGADGSVDITIRDQGQGFDSSTIPDPTVPESRMSTHGRGIYLMRAMMDEVRFEDRGTIVHMRKNPNPKRVRTLP